MGKDTFLSNKYLCYQTKLDLDLLITNFKSIRSKVEKKAGFSTEKAYFTEMMKAFPQSKIISFFTKKKQSEEPLVTMTITKTNSHACTTPILKYFNT